MGMLFVFGQEEKDLGTQEITVTKAFKPNIKNVIKKKESPQFLDSLSKKKYKINYQIFSVPVASTFTPAKGDARKLESPKTPIQYNSGITMGYGSFNQRLIQYNSLISMEKQQELGWIIHYSGLSESIPELLIPSTQSDFLTHFSHRKITDKNRVFTQLNFKQNQYYFYGLRSQINSQLLNGIDAKQKLNYFTLSSDWLWFDKLIKDAKFNMGLTTDAFSTNELYLDFVTTFQKNLGSVALFFSPEIAHLNSNFDHEYYSKQSYAYQSTLGKASLFASKSTGNFKFKIGVSAVLSLDSSSEKEWLFFPQMSLSYLTKNGKLLPFLDIGGEIKQNSFRDFTHFNPFIAPAIQIQTSTIPFRLVLGARTKLSSGWRLEGNVSIEENEKLPIFRHFGLDSNQQNISPFRLGNSFEVIYIPVVTGAIEANLKAPVNSDLVFNFNLRYVNYFNSNDSITDVQTNDEVSNLPNIFIDLDGRYSIGKHVVFQWLLAHRGARTNSYPPDSTLSVSQNVPHFSERLPAFTQLDMSIDFKINPRLNFFAKGNNLLNQTYYQWSNYRVYSTNFLIGLRYNFEVSL